MTKLFVPAYWPLFKTGELRRFDYKGTDMPPFTSVFSYDKGSDSMLYDNFDSSFKWLNRWYYQYRTGDRKSTRLNSSHSQQSRMPSSA